MSLRHKYKAIKCESDCIKFPSRLERDYYNKLRIAVKAGEMVMFLRQPKFDLGGGATYSADFLEFHNDGSVRVVDCKGFLTKEFIMKKKIVESLYPVTIEVVKKV